MLPLLQFHSDGKEHNFREMVEALAKVFQLTKEEQGELIRSGTSKFDNRVGWARTYLKKAGLLSAPRRGLMAITPSGLELLRQEPDSINISLLSQFEEFRQFRALRHPKTGGVLEPESESTETTPEEALENAYQKLRTDLASDLLLRMRTCSPTFFERLVVEVIVKMGYGGTLQDAGRAVGRSGDEGIDGIIKEDKLGLDVIYIQAKKWENTVGRPEIQKFVGALTGQRARKGIFITTSDFSAEAVEYVNRIDAKVVLIDGETLAGLMIDHSVGVSTVTAYELKKVDSDYFSEE